MEPRGPLSAGTAAVFTDALRLRRILIVTDAWSPQINGVVRTYEAISAALIARGCDVKVIGPAAFASVALPSYPEIPLAVRPYRQLSAMIEHFAPEAIHIGVEGPLGWAARSWCLRHGRSFSTAFHTNFPAYVALRAPLLLQAPAAQFKGCAGGHNLPAALLPDVLRNRVHLERDPEVRG